MSQNNGQFNCPDCGDSFDSEKGLKTHRGLKHKDGSGARAQRTITPERVLALGLVVVGALIFVNQLYLMGISDALEMTDGGGATVSAADVDVDDEEVYEIQSTGQALATVFPELQEAENQDDIKEVLLPNGAPEYSDILGGITFDDPEGSLQYLAQRNRELKEEIRRNHPDTWERFLDLAAAPRGLSCEFCCGLEAQAVDEDGNTMCGCQHQPGIEAVVLGLMHETDMSDAEVMREGLRWKSAWFPRDMVALGAEVAGQDPSEIEGQRMVGGC